MRNEEKVRKVAIGTLGLSLLGWAIRIAMAPDVSWKFLWFDTATLVTAGAYILASAMRE